MVKWLRKNKKELIWYLLVGLLGVVIDYAGFFFFKWLGLTILIAQWIAAIIGSLHNHLWFHYAVFDHNQHIKRTSFWSFWLVVIGIALSGPALLAVNYMLNNLVLSKLVVIAFFTVLQYVIRKKVIFVQK